MASLPGQLPAETVTSIMKTEGDTGRYNTRGRTRRSNETPRTWTFAQDWQRDILRRRFEENAYPDRKELDRIGGEVGMEVKWLKNWYHSQRKKKNVRKETTKMEDIKQEVEEEGGEADVEDDNDVTEDADVGDSLESAHVGGDEKARLLEDLQRRFTELEARYTVMAGLLLERGILRAEEADQLPDTAADPGDTLAETAAPGDQEAATTPEAATTQPQVKDEVAACQAAVPVKEENEVKQEAAPVYPAPLPAQYPAYPYTQFYPAPPPGYLPYHTQYFPLAQSQPQQPPPAGPQAPLAAPPGYPQGYPLPQTQPPPAGQPQYQPHYPPLVHHYPPAQFAPQAAPQPS